MAKASTHMSREIAEIPEAARRLAAPEARARMAEVAQRLRKLDPPALVTIARGSSDHAATYLKYVAEVTLGLPVASIGPSTVTIHDTAFRARGLAALAISQSGSSQDLTALASALSAGGADVIALTNKAGSKLAGAADEVIDIAAGPELAVAATKSFVNSIIAGMWLVALWAEDDALCTALDRLPEALERRSGVAEAQAAFARLQQSDGALVIGRGVGLGLACETALKLVETCGMHASAYSGAEVLHGPSAILSDGFPVIALTTGAGRGMDQAIAQLTEQGAAVTALPPPQAPGTIWSIRCWTCRPCMVRWPICRGRAACPRMRPASCGKRQSRCNGSLGAETCAPAARLKGLHAWYSASPAPCGREAIVS